MVRFTVCRCLQTFLHILIPPFEDTSEEMEARMVAAIPEARAQLIIQAKAPLPARGYGMGRYGGGLL